MNPLPFLDLKALNLRFEDEFAAALRRILDRGWYVKGEEVRAFEAEWARFCGVPHCVGVGNGLDALTLALRAWIELGRLAPGDEAVLPANSFIATALAVSQAGLVPVLADPDPHSCNLSVPAAAAAITPRTRVLLPVHLYGRLADMEGLRSLADAHGLLLLEDAAQAHGARRHGRAAGSFGDAAAFSFFPGKNLGALGDGGAVVTQDAELAACVASLGNYGSARKYHHDRQGMNSRLDELQAAFLRIKLRHLEADNAAREDLARRYCEDIVNPCIELPALPETSERHAWHLFVVRCAARDALQAHLRAAGIETLVHYPLPIHRQPAYAAMAWPPLPVAESLAGTVLSLPLHPGLRDPRRVVDACNAFRP